MSDDNEQEGEYANIRHENLLAPFIGQRVVEITQHDREEWEETKQSYFALHFENGYTLKVPIGDEGFDIVTPGDTFPHAGGDDTDDNEPLHR